MRRLSLKLQLAQIGRRFGASRKQWFERAAFWGGGLTVGLTAVVMALGAEWAQDLFHRIHEHWRWWSLGLTPAGFAVSAWLTRRFFNGAQGSGIPQAIVAQETESASIRDRLLGLHVAAGKIVLTLFGMLAGASIGREGPSVQVGASIMNAVGRFWGRQQQALIVAGAAAGVAAAFNTPLGGIVFAIEEMSRSLHRGVNGLILGAVIISGIAALAITGSYTYFGRVQLTLESSQWLAVLLCGVVCGLIGGLFSLLVSAVSTGRIANISRDIRERPIQFAAACGLLVAVIGLLSGGATFGTGYEPARALLEGHDTVWHGYGILKLLATALSAVSGIPGGMFSPSLSVGAGLGADLHNFMPQVPVGTMALLAMVAYFSGVVQAPITAFVIVAEMTGSYSLTVPLMSASWIGYASARLIGARPIYHALAEPMRQKPVAEQVELDLGIPAPSPAETLAAEDAETERRATELDEQTSERRDAPIERALDEQPGPSAAPQALDDPSRPR
jgi:H+/Cl- antiporter ClcA